MSSETRSNITILQLSHWLVGLEGPSDDLLSAVDDLASTLGDRQIDYLVFCGNLTNGGQAEAFEKASDLLYGLATKIFGNRLAANRVILVPGECDLGFDNETSRFATFNAFREKLCRRLSPEGPPVQEMGPRIPVVYELKDCTFIVAPYCETQLDSADLFRLLDHAKGAVADLQYCKSTPTILVSSASPVVTWHSRRILDDRMSDVTAQLRLTMHLFGASPVVVMPFEPFVFRHVGIATGPREPGSVHPIRANVIEIRTTTDTHSPSTVHKTRRYTLHAYVRPHAGQRWVEASWMDGEALSLLDPQIATSGARSALFRHLLNNLQEWLNRTDDMERRVEYLPGVGISDWFAHLAKTCEIPKTSEIPGWQVKYLRLPRRQPSSEGALLELWDQEEEEELHRLFDQILPEIDDNEDHTIVVLDDQTYHYRDSSATWLAAVYREFNRLPNMVKRLYLLTPRIAPREFAFRFSRAIKVQPAARQDVLSYLSSFHLDMPYDEQVLSRLAGGMIELSSLMLEEGRNAFRWRSGDTLVTDETSTTLLLDSLRGRDVQATLDSVRAAVARMERGAEFLAALDRPGGLLLDPPLPITLPVITQFRDIVDFLLCQGLLYDDKGVVTMSSTSTFVQPELPTEDSDRTSRVAGQPSITTIHLYYSRDQKDANLVKEFKAKIEPLLRKERLRLIDGHAEMTSAGVALFFLSDTYLAEAETLARKRRDLFFTFWIALDVGFAEKTKFADAFLLNGDAPLFQLERPKRDISLHTIAERLVDALRVKMQKGRS